MTSPATGRPLRRRALPAAFAALGLLGTFARAQSGDADSVPDAASLVDSHPELQWGARDKFDRVRFMNGFSVHFTVSPQEPTPEDDLFFPPIPPVLESDIPVVAPLGAGPPAPLEMSGFVGETFYPFLAARLAQNELSQEMRARILAYRDAKGALIYELHSRLLSLKDADPQEQARQLGDLAKQQDIRIAELSWTAEKIRNELRPKNVFGVELDSHDMKKPGRLRIGPASQTPSDPEGLLRESEALKDAAFYQDGLSDDQRHLLFECAIEMHALALPPQSPPPAATRVVSFSPETARIRLPADLAADVEQRISVYVAAKDRLKAEMRDALHEYEDSDPGARSDALAALASAESERFSEIHSMAENIRSSLAQLPNPPGPPVPRSLPPDLAARISAYHAHKVGLLKTLRGMLASPTPAGKGAAAATTNAEDPVSGSLAWLHDGTTSTEIQPANLAISVDEFHRVQSELIEEINREEEGIRASLAEYMRGSNGPSDRKSINDLLRDFEDARQREEAWDKYRDYQTAVLMPGLSPRQRQILFEAAVGELDLPLPPGENAN